jgi:hypothetical protein
MLFALLAKHGMHIHDTGVRLDSPACAQITSSVQSMECRSYIERKSVGKGCYYYVAGAGLRLNGHASCVRIGQPVQRGRSVSTWYLFVCTDYLTSLIIKTVYVCTPYIHDYCTGLASTTLPTHVNSFPFGYRLVVVAIPPSP